MDDINAPPSARLIPMHSKLRKVSVDIEFKDRQRLNGAEIQKCIELGIPDDENVLFCYFNGELATPAPISFNKNGIIFGGITFSGNTILHCGTGIHIA